MVASSETLPNGTHQNGDSPQANGPASASELPPEALALAGRLFDMARAGDQTLISYIQAGIPPNLTNSSGDTLLMLAAYHNRPELVSALLSKGSDPNICNDKGQSPLAGAVFKGYEQVVQMLVDEGKADIRAGKPTAVECAAMFKRFDIAKTMGVEDEARRIAPQLNPVGSRDAL